jgi:hypothetical protein
MKRLRHLQVAVTLRAPWLVHGNDPGRLGLDAVQLRGPNGQRVLPGTLLLGRLRESWEELGSMVSSMAGAQNLAAPDVVEWLGPKRIADKDLAHREPQRTRLFVDDLIEVETEKSEASANPESRAPSHRLKMDEETGAGQDGMLMFIEQGELPGAEISFTGTWRAWLDDDEAAPMANWIAKGLRWHTQLGALRNVGFGAVVNVGVKVAPRPTVNAPTRNPFVAGDAQHPRGLLLHFSQPLAVGNRLVNGNLFSSSDVIPGAAIKGALATMLKAQGRAIPAWFDALRVTQGRPSATAKRPAPLPLSLVANRKGKVWELRDDGTAMHGGDALAFSGDWKKPAQTTAGLRQGWGRTRNYLRVRTAIEGGRAADSALFAYECKVADTNEPGDDGKARTTCWTVTLDLPDEYSAGWGELAELLAEATIGPLGKTDAFASIKLVPSMAPVWDCDLAITAGAEAHLLLASDALLFAASSVASHTSTTPVDLLAVYRRSFDEMAEARLPGSKGCLTLTRFYASQRFAGGDYLHRRRRANHAAPYSPYVLTEAGSMFVFKVADQAKATELLRLWQLHGLSHSLSVATEHGSRWDTNPYLPQNGYGEVCVNPQHGFEALPRAER